jgi:hypothetical protein
MKLFGSRITGVLRIMGGSRGYILFPLQGSMNREFSLEKAGFSATAKAASARKKWCDPLEGFPFFNFFFRNFTVE